MVQFEAGFTILTVILGNSLDIPKFDFLHPVIHLPSYHTKLFKKSDYIGMRKK